MGDVRGYYAALGVNPTDTLATIKTAYRRLAKECHPDRGNVTDGGARFHMLTEAYDVLSNVDRRCEYDGSDEQEPSTENEQNLVELIVCDECGKVAAQPRRILFWRVTSFILATNRTPIQKIFCNKCAAGEEWKSTVWTGLLGWWGVPWGPAWSIAHGAKNALGGTREPDVDEALYWQNAVAFATRGQLDLAVGLANFLRKSENAEQAQRAADLIRYCGGQGADTAASLKDVWNRSFGRTLGLLLAAFFVPAAVIAYVLAPSGSGSGTQSADTFLDDSPLAEPAPAAPPPTEAIEPETMTVTEVLCQSKPENGELLADGRSDLNKGHVLSIDNGTEGDAIVKVRDAATDKPLVSFFVRRGLTAELTGIPDGTYKFQYAFGDLAENCKEFARLNSAGEFPGSESFTTQYEPEYGGTRISRARLSYTLYATPGGNVNPSMISAEEFNR